MNKAFIKTLPGFIDFTEECFTIDEYVLNNCEWKEGFFENNTEC